ncbi:intraflagellar transport 54 [Arctopsyche grandis]|uniref:intraflagellar transport 54 n=1 Tax=Arctopsyche grandis TaxID=121162 RepID=UPI00406D73B2
MSADISLEVVKTTQETLGQFVKRPPLTEKLLRKPPFRFLHDIVKAVIKNTGFFDGLFTEEELVSENIKDRDKKIVFLQKIIEVINIVTESSLSVRPSKIISGQEPEKTNELLQKIGEALQQNLNSSQAVKMVTSKNISPKAAVEEKVAKTNSKTSKTEKKNLDKDAKLKTDEKKVKSISKTESTVKSKVSNRTKKTEENKNKPISDKNVNNEPKLKSQKSIDRSTARDINSSKRVNEKKSIVDPKIIHEDESIETNHTESKEINETEHSNEIIEMKPIINIEEVSKNSNKKDSTQGSRPTSHDLRNSDPFISLQSDIPSIPNDMLEDKSEIENIRTEHNVEESRIIDENSENSTKNEKSREVSAKMEPIKPNESSNKEIKNRAISTKSIRGRDTIAKNKSVSLDEDSESKSLSKNEKNSIAPTNISEVKRPTTSLRPPSVRPSSSRPGAPRFKDSNVDIITSTTEIVPKAKVNIIVENYDNQPEEDDGSVVVEQTIFDENVIDGEFSKPQPESVISGHGHLVQQILETKKELDGDTSKVEIEWEWGARREREASFKEVESLRNGLQSLSRAANPLGKLMDYVQEDVEIMRQELLHWREARHNAANTLNHQENLTEKSIQPLEAKLKQLDESIADQMELIYTVKSNIYRNEQKIRRLVDRDEFKYT